MRLVSVRGNMPALQASAAVSALGRGGQNWVVTIARLVRATAPGEKCLLTNQKREGIRAVLSERQP